MRIVVDALVAHYGGQTNYVRGLLGAWTLIAPEDELTVLLTEPFGRTLTTDPNCSRHRLVIYPRRWPSFPWRMVRSETQLPKLQSKADALLSTTTSLPTAWHRASVVVVHDLRHEDRPGDFSPARRLARHYFFGAALRRADRLLANSDRTAEVLRRRHPETNARISVAHLAADHVPLSFSTRDGDAVAFGHHAVKDPALLLEVWQLLLQRSHRPLPRLHIVGLGAHQRDILTRRAVSLGIVQNVVLDPYLDSKSLDGLMRAASVVLLPSRYEGFGLPVLEAMRQGIPTVISPDPALREVAGGHAACATTWAPVDLADAVGTALNMTPEHVAAARQHSDRFTWRRTAELTRESVEWAVRHHRNSR
jgi:glycosyltransferase involved in cell wall biosynthesis